ncbi:hypothetical protein [Methylomicrobium sp. Wu6]|uniref:hypothetical protein n=1 Tax=Methylomicrobium sp. Wu6 TaxID=3107928 RepID=UPI002DD61CEF|nr:hypothetical protein [Methylomicrobium sp. Wu6]MEC4748014.1 hypothetical protein [Methylomicrobium sp. Wu6]
MNEALDLIADFLRDAELRGVAFFNEAELQHELGYWLRAKLPVETNVHFERPADSFFPKAVGLVKKEIDLIVAGPNKSWHLAIELKCPRNGRVPETMFDACKDLQFLEQLVASGFRAGAFIMHVEDPAFYQSGLQTGIYSHFRAGTPLTGVIAKPTGKKDLEVRLANSYSVHWRPYGMNGRYWFERVSSVPNQPLNLTPESRRSASRLL